MANPSTRWDFVPVFGVYLRLDDTPSAGRITFTMPSRVTRVDGRVIYPEGASVTVTIGDTTQQDSAIRSAVRAAWRAADEASQGAGFNAVAWDTWWDDIVVPAAIFTSFPAANDPDIVQQGWSVSVSEGLTSGKGRSYAIQPLLAQLDQPIPGINLGTIEVPPGSPTVPAPMYAKGVAGGVAALDADGDVVDAGGNKVAGAGGGTGGGVAEVSGVVDLGTTPGLYEVYALDAATVQGVALVAGDAAVFRLLGGVWSYMVVGVHTSWQAVPSGPGDPVAVVASAPTWTDDTINGGGSWSTPTIAGVTYSPASGTVTPGQSVTVTATAQAGYTLSGTTSWTHTFPVAPVDPAPGYTIWESFTRADGTNMNGKTAEKGGVTLVTSPGSSLAGGGDAVVTAGAVGPLTSDTGMSIGCAITQQAAEVSVDYDLSASSSTRVYLAARKLNRASSTGPGLFLDGGGSLTVLDATGTVAGVTGTSGWPVTGRLTLRVVGTTATATSGTSTATWTIPTDPAGTFWAAGVRFTGAKMDNFGVVYL